MAASSPLTRLRDQRRMTKLVRRHVGRRTTPSDAEVAWLAHACTDVLVRDEAMFLLDRENAARHVKDLPHIGVAEPMISSFGS